MQCHTYTMTYSSEIFEKPKNTYYIHNLMMHKSFSKFKIFIEMFCKNYKKKKDYNTRQSDFQQAANKNKAAIKYF